MNFIVIKFHLDIICPVGCVKLAVRGVVIGNKKELQVHRVLSMYERLKSGESIIKREEAAGAIMVAIIGYSK